MNSIRLLLLATILLTINNILEIQGTLEENSAGFRKLPGTELKNERTSEIVYIPPQDVSQIKLLMNNLSLGRPRFPISSFFFVSTLILGNPARWNLRRWRAI